MKSLHAVLLVVMCLAQYGCASATGNYANNYLKPMVSGSRIPFEEWNRTKDQKIRFVVWGNHPGATQRAVEVLKALGHIVVERARLMEIFDEQRIQLTHSTDDDARILKVGRLAGAQMALFIEVLDRPEVVSVAYGSVSNSSAVHHVNVAVRGVNVETGEIRWNGRATYDRPINNPEVGIDTLTFLAVAYPTCQPESGEVEWIDWDGAPGGKMGCWKKEH